MRAQHCPANAPPYRWRIRYRPDPRVKGTGAPIQECYAGPDEADARELIERLEADGDIVLAPAASLADPAAPRCHVCGSPLGDDLDGGEVPRQSLKNRRFLAKLDPAGEIAAECCEPCAQEAEAEA